MKDAATPIKDITKKVIGLLSGERQKKEEKIKEAWENAVGKRFSSHTQPTSLRKKKLIVSVDSSSMLYELTMRKRKIVAKLKKDLKDDITEIQLRIGEIER